MGRWLVGLVGLAFVVGACGNGVPTPEPAESMPALASPPTGWVSAGGMGGNGGSSFGGGIFPLCGRRTAIDAACAGSGTLVVLISPMPITDIAQAGLSATFPCITGAIAQSSVELTGMVIPDTATVSATVVEGLGTLRHASYSISIEQPAP